MPVRAGSDAAATAAKVKQANPDAVVLATPDNGDQTKALIGALTAAGYGGAKLWLTSQNLADYSQALPAGLLNGANGILEGVQPDEAFTARLEAGGSRPRRPPLRPGVVRRDHPRRPRRDPRRKRRQEPRSRPRFEAVTRGGIKCTSFGECLDVLRTETDIDYDGITGALAFDDAGDRETASYGLYTYTGENKYAAVRRRHGLSNDCVALHPCNPSVL